MAPSQKVEEMFHSLLPDIPLAPPQGGVCLINNIPPELLSYIFVVGTLAKDEEGNNDSLTEIDLDFLESSSSLESSESFLPFRLLVSNICRHWRNIALSTPFLWTNIEVTPTAGLSLEPTLTLLERSKDLPITVYIYCQGHAYDGNQAPSDDELRSLFSTFIPHVHRWRAMMIGIPEYRHVYEFLSAASDPSIPAASQLTTLMLEYPVTEEARQSFVYPDMSEHFTLFRGSAPLLTTLSLWGVHVDWNQPWIASASNLTELELAFHAEDVRPSWSQFATILRGAPSLEELALHHSGPSGNPANWFIRPTFGSPADLNAPIQFLRLRDLTFEFHSEAHAIELLRKFYLPALKKLTLHFDVGDFTNLVRELARSATSLSPTQEPSRSLLNGLESLKIVKLRCRIECIRILYEQLQNVTSLNISLENLPSPFLDILAEPCTFPRRANVWLPQLATLYVSGAFGNSLRYVVGQRRNAGAPLSALHLKECEVDDEDEEWLKENVETVKYIFDDSCLVSFT